jgi:hypothetical protein
LIPCISAAGRQFCGGNSEGHDGTGLAHRQTKSWHFKPGEFEDRCEDAPKELLKKKRSGEKIEAPRQREPAKVINLKDALRRRR